MKRGGRRHIIKKSPDLGKQKNDQKLGVPGEQKPNELPSEGPPCYRDRDQGDEKK